MAPTTAQSTRLIRSNNSFTPFFGTRGLPPRKATRALRLDETAVNRFETKLARHAFVIACALAATIAKADDSDLPCAQSGWVKAASSLVITDLTVVNDVAARNEGPWSFAHALAGALPAAEHLGRAAYEWLDQYGTVTELNGFSVTPRTPGAFLSNWARVGAPDGTIGIGADLDPAKSPVRLLAIVFRPDLVHAQTAPQGEARLVFGATDRETGTKNLTIIFEYGLPDGFAWAPAFAALSEVHFGPAYNTALQALTARFVEASGGETHLLRLRTNEQYFGQGWDLREFHVDGAGARFVQTPVAQTPDLSLNGNGDLLQWINDNAAAVHAGQYELPEKFLGGTGFLVDDHFAWFKGAPGLDPGLRADFAKNTCNGCHGRETDTRFLHIAPRLAVEPAALSPFLKAQLPIRRARLEAQVCVGAPP